ncbi:MAG: ATP-binding cassette domain-containing protein, partial [Alphaproteobacteria bacterium]|nr:ATP-binding cassette domain-containing protein [Alphaproteobacteria bacterium]
MSTPAIEIRDLEKRFIVKQGLFGTPRHVRAVDGVTLSIPTGATLGIVGESGCGKSTL